VFDLPAFSPGVLKATGFIGGKPVASHRVATPGAPERLDAPPPRAIDERRRERGREE